MSIQRVGVLGLGLMGSGIAQVTAAAGYQVLCVDSNSEATSRGMAAINKSLSLLASKAVAKGLLDASAATAQAASTLSRISTSTSMSAFEGCDLVIEAISEDMKVKSVVYKSLSKVLKPGAIMASNTSSLSITKLGELFGRPEHTM